MMPRQYISTQSSFVTHYAQYYDYNALFQANHTPWQSWPHNLTTLTILLDNVDNIPWQRTQYSLTTMKTHLDNANDTHLQRWKHSPFNWPTAISYTMAPVYPAGSVPETRKTQGAVDLNYTPFIPNTTYIIM
jgi:hypothetical protein